MIRKLNIGLTFTLRFLPLMPLTALVYLGTIPMQPEEQLILYEVMYGFIAAVLLGNPWAVLSRWLCPLTRVVLASGMAIAYTGYKLNGYTNDLVRVQLMVIGVCICGIAWSKRKDWMATFAVHQSWRVDEVINVFAYASEIEAVELWEKYGIGELRAVLRQNLHINLTEEALTYSHKAAYLLGYLTNLIDVEAIEAEAKEQIRIARQQALDAAKVAKAEADTATKELGRKYKRETQELLRLRQENAQLRDKVYVLSDPWSKSYEEYFGGRGDSVEELMREKGWVRIEQAPEPEIKPATTLTPHIPTAEEWQSWVAHWEGEASSAEPEHPVLQLLRPEPEEEPEPEELEEEELKRPTWGSIAERNELIRAYKAEGHTHAETARYFGISEPLSKKVCNS